MTVSKRQLKALLESGVDPLEVCRVLNVPLGRVAEAGASPAEYTPTEEELADRAKRLRWRAFQEAEDCLRNGAPAVRQRLVAALLGREMKAASEVDLELVAMKVEFETMLGEDADIDEAEVVE